jgi:predicted nucleic-acid-binding protein
MIGIDTNVLLRLFEINENPTQTAAARQAVEEHAPVFISATVLVEFAWTLRRAFKLDRAAVHRRLKGVVNATEFVTAFAEETRRAVDLYETGPVDFSDYLLGELNRAAGCETTLTFDQDAAKHSAFRSLAA